MINQELKKSNEKSKDQALNNRPLHESNKNDSSNSLQLAMFYN
jgi:hypothetical protein